MVNEKLNSTVFVNTSMAANATSSAIPLLGVNKVAIQAVFVNANSLAPNGTFTLQVSNNQSTWTTIAASSTTITAAGDVMWNIADLAYPYIRVVFTRSSGDGTLNCTAFIKEVI